MIIGRMLFGMCLFRLRLGRLMDPVHDALLPDSDTEISSGRPMPVIVMVAIGTTATGTGLTITRDHPHR